MTFLDTNAVIALLNGHPLARKRFEAAVARQNVIAVSSVVTFELRYGIAKSTRRQHNADRLATFLSGPVEVLPFENEDAERAADVRAVLDRSGVPIGPYDVLIAGQALRHGSALVTANTEEFSRVPGLKLENWMVARK